MRRKSIISLLFLIQGLLLMGQYYNTGQDPASLKWKKLDSYHFRFIYPESYSGEISKMVFAFEKAYDLLKGSYNEPRLKRIPVIIHNYSIESNGYVAWAPGRVELFPYPGQDNIPMSHIEQLALHELMHVLQMSSFRRGISKTLSYVFGEQYTGALGIFTPFWFLEGEAVLAETAWSYSGRGRIPSFEKRLKAVVLDNEEIFSYDKLLFGSYKDYTPDHYQFGYQMSAWARSQFGDNVWQEPMDYVALRTYTINPFNAALNKYTNHKKDEIYYESMVFLKNKWKKEEQESSIEKYRIINPDKENEYINYYSPVFAGEGRIIALKTSLYRTPEFVSIDIKSGDEKKLFTPGSIWPYRFDFAGNRIYWAENYNDPRWQNRDYSVIKSYDITNGRSKTLSSATRWFSPTASPDGKMIAVSESTADYKNSIVIIDAMTGSVISRHYIPGNKFISNPSWSDNPDEIVFISSNDSGEGIMILDINNGQWNIILEEARNDLQSVSKHDGFIYFVSSASGTDNAFMIDKDGEIKQLTSSRFGIIDLSVNQKQLLFSDYTSNGNEIAVRNIDNSNESIGVDVISKSRFIDSLDSEEKLETPSDYTLPSNYKEEKYNKLTNLFRFHSWMPFYADVNNISFDQIPVSLGATVMTQNNLSTLVSTLGYEYTNREHLFHSTVSWKGWYPALDFNISYGGEPLIYNSNDTTALPSEMYKGLSANTTLYLPLHFNRSRYIQTVWPSVNIRYSNNYILDENEDNFDYGQTLINTRVYLSNLHRMSYRDIWPRFGQVLDIYHTRSLYDQDLYGPVTSIRTAVYLPGLMRNHGIKVRYEFEKQQFRRLLIHNRVSLPRGYDHIISETTNSFSLDYAFPIAYPDFNAGSFLYLKRIRNTAFYDYAIGNNIYNFKEHESFEGNDYMSSAGLELLADFYLLRIPFTFSAGIQAAYMPFERSTHFRLLFNMDVFGFVLDRNNQY